MPVLTLKHPIEFNGKKIEALTLRRARGGDLRFIDRSGLLGLMMRADKEATELMKKAPELTREEAVARCMPDGMLDKMGPVLARMTDTEEALIDALDADDFSALGNMLDEAMPKDPLAQPTANT